MLGNAQPGEPLTIGEATTAWRMTLRLRWTEDAVLREEVGDRVYMHFTLEEIRHRAA